MRTRHAVGIAPLITLAVLSFPLLGAEGGGCSAEPQPGGGPNGAWDAGEAGVIPTAKGPDEPMTCEWLEGNNCWKQLYAAVDACAPSESGTFSEDGKTCAFPGGARMELGTSSLSVGGLTFVDHRVLDPSGDLCFSSKTLGWGKGAFTTRAGTGVIEWLSWSTYRFICPDGSSFVNTGEGACADNGTRFRERRMPNYSLECSKGDGGDGSCVGTFWGTADGPKREFACK